MKPLEEARSEVLSSVGLLGVELVPIWQARGRVLASDVVAPENVPPVRQLRYGRVRRAWGRRLLSWVGPRGDR